MTLRVRAALATAVMTVAVVNGIYSGWKMQQKHPARHRTIERAWSGAQVTPNAGNFELTVTVEGEGSVSPGAGSYPAGSKVTLTAKPERGWVTDHWYGQLASARRLYGNSVDVVMESNRLVSIRFEQRPGSEDLQMYRDFATFLWVLGVQDSPESFDHNATRYGSGSANSYGPNGIPDAAELGLIEAIVKDPHLELSCYNGGSEAFVSEIWCKNLLQAVSDLKEAPFPKGVNHNTMARVVAGYMTLGDISSLESVQSLLRESFPTVSLDVQRYQCWGAAFLSKDCDPDYDGIGNADEWRYAGGKDFQSRIFDFAGLALDHNYQRPYQPHGTNKRSHADEK